MSMSGSETGTVLTETTDESRNTCPILPLLTNEDESSQDVANTLHGLSIDSGEARAPTQDLDSFREQWKKELDHRSHSQPREDIPGSDRSEHEVRASELFLEGVEYEKRGEMAEAVRKYTRAVKLVPDIEQRVCAPQAVVKQGGRTRSVSRDRASTAVQGVGTGAAISIAEEGDTEEHFSVQLKKNIVERGALFQAKDPAHPCHFQHLPSELLHLLVRYVVGSGVDVRTSNALCEVSAMMYVLNREDELWRSILFRTVGEEIALQRWSEHSVVSWRELYLTTPHLLFDGLYVSKSSYIRHGEAGFQDKNFRPWFTITFYRLMRFYPNGTLLMTTTSESPQSAANLLKEHSTQKFDSNVLVGTWWLEDDEVVGNVKRENEIALPKKTARRGHGEEIPEYRVFRHEFAIRLRFVPRRTHRWGLQWAENICTITYFDGTQSTSDMDAEKDYQSFPPLRFHRVPSYGITYDNKLD